MLMLLLAGELTAAAALVEEQQAAAEATGICTTTYSSVAVAALRGSEQEASAQSEAALANAVSLGEGIGITVVEWANAMLGNSRGHYDKALVAAERAAGSSPEPTFLNWVLAELVEAAARGGTHEKAAAAYQRLAERTAASGTDWALGIDARSSALLSEGAGTERLYRAAIARLSKTQLRVEIARAHLLTGSGCAGSAAAVSHASNSARLKTCSRRWVRQRSPNGPGRNCGLPGKPPAGAPPSPPTKD
jgi:hypothetical protein